MTFAMQPEFMHTFNGAQTGAHALITGSYSGLTSAQLAGWSMTYGPLAVANMIPTLYETAASNFTSAMETAVKHLELGVASTVVEGAHEAVDSVTEV
ncbi:hypothetical protein [Mycobacterium sp. 852002-51163_SCH5372311]|uniref:hypothetical protein n=1 Tax=Mycobacterium sp. 852002-51163_SCH5372311 TaxID=1834097 RepID=UPI000A5F05DE|nr:hypothetical protein [Mycobacterium sp. 852002-51163_SCH5372311]